MIENIYFLIVSINILLNLQGSSDKNANLAIDMIKLKADYPYVFADYNPAKSAYPDPSYIYNYKYQDQYGEYQNIGLSNRLNEKGYKYIGKEKFQPIPYFEIKIDKSHKTRFYYTCGRKPMKPLFTADGIPIEY